MKIAHVGNMANDAYVTVKALRDINVACDLYIDLPQHVCGLPQWETCRLTEEDIGDPYYPDMKRLNQDFQQPKWMYFFDLAYTYSLPPLKLLSLLPTFPTWPILHKVRVVMREGIWWLRYRSSQFLVDLMEKYDLIVAHVPYSVYAARTHKPFIAFDAGAVRCLRGYWIFPYPQMRMALLEDAYKRADAVLVTNPDTMDLFREYGIDRTWFMPFLIDVERYKPVKVDNDLPYEYVVFHPTRQCWREKGNHFLIRAFAKFHKEERDSVLVIVDWSIDRDKTKNLVKKLDLNDSVVYLNLQSKPHLIEWYNKATVVDDQHILGSYGTTAPEAMACKKPVIMYLSKKHMVEAFGEMPPILNAGSIDQIYEKLQLCTDKSFLKKQGDLSRRWVLKHHSPEVVANKHLEIYNKILR